MQYAATRSLNPMLTSWGNFGTFLFYSLIALAGCIFVFFFMPETAGMQLEDIHTLFDKPWYRIGWTANRRNDRQKSSKDSITEAQTATPLGYSNDSPDNKSLDEDDKKH